MYKEFLQAYGTRQLAKLRETFAEFDADSSGYIDAEEFFKTNSDTILHDIVL